MKFEEIFSAMKELANEGSQFFRNAIKEYESAIPEKQESMRNWLEGEFSDYDPELWDVKTCLLSMMYAE